MEWYRLHAAGTVALPKGSAPGHLLVVVRGSLEMILNSRHGAEQMLRLVRTGDCVAAEAIFCDQPVVYELRTLTEATLLCLPRHTVLAWLDASPDFSRRFMQVIAQGVTHLYEELEGIQNNTTDQRLACYLHCGENRGQHKHSGQDFTVPFTYRKLAQRLGTSPPHLSRTMRTLEGAGIIGRTGRQVEVRDRAAFAGLLCATCRRADEACR